MIERVTKVLAESGAELSQEEFLDALWLAGKLSRASAPLARAAGVPDAPRPSSDTPHHDEPPSPTAESAGTAAEPADTAPADSTPARPLLAAERHPAHEYAGADTGAAPSPAIAVRAPDTRPFGTGQQRLGKALQPLRQPFPDPSRHELDLVRTVAAMADTGLPEAVTRPARTRWLSLALVVDDGVSMVLWQRLAAEIKELMERAGAFRDVRVYGLDTRGATPSLRSSPYRHRGLPQSPRTLCDPTGNTLVLVVSDGVGDAWWDGGMRQVTERWARCGPTAIVQALPSRLWASTGIGARRWQVTTHRRGGPTHTWHVTDPDLPLDLVRYDSVPVPVLEPTPAAVADWARLIASSGGTALLPLWDTAPSVTRAPDATAPRRIDDAEAVLRFREAATPEAYRLAAHVAAVSPVTPPVMRLVQAALGPPTDPGHLMEVFLGGLMHEEDTGEPDRLPHHRRFDFSGEARRVLLSAVPPKELLCTTDTVTRRIEEAVGRAPVFPAWVGHPDGTALVGDAGRSFGWLRDQLLAWLGIPPAAAEPVMPTADRDHTAQGQAEEPPPYDDELGEILPAGWVELLPLDPVRVGRFRLQARSAWGWRHVVMFLARDEDDTLVTVRVASVLHADDPAAALALIRTEAECLLRMAGTYAPSLVDVRATTAEEPPWLAATCVHRRADDASSGPAPNLRAVLDEYGGTVPKDLFLRIGFALCEALARAHRLGIVHGSLAPRSVLVSDHDVRLVGWATATLDGTDSAHREEFPTNQGSLHADDGGPSLTSRSDVYAAGGLLLAFLSGRWLDPRAGDEDWGPLATPGVDPVLVGMLRRCLRREPALRPSADDLAEAFAAASGATSEKSLVAIAEDVHRMRLLAAQDPSGYGREFARLLRTYANRLASVGRRQESLDAAEEGVRLYRELVSAEGDHHVSGLAASLSNLSVGLGEAGRASDGLVAITEAESLYRELAHQDVDLFGSGHSMVLNNLSHRLAEAVRLQEALQAVEEAVAIDRRVVVGGLTDHEDGLAMSLANLGSRLGDLGRSAEALRAVTEAVHIYRALPSARARRVWTDFAVSLNNLAVLLGALGRHEEALTTLDECAAVVHRFGGEPSGTASEVLEQSERVRLWLGALRAEATER
ncbi:SAV_2336 family protein [Streptomyces sp. NBC_01102]|uniref:SAV_2336 N-terminal domain-related protein n=1 Tax=Streptomyces sp. NBC_01102 TaxID=2903749 RepID=UPI0038645595|nr:SAV_2336 family protein [Streptomyces sp. NBC_01102]